MTIKNKIIKVLLVDDSLLSLRMLERLLEDADDIEVVGLAHDGKMACTMIKEKMPDVICTDYHMPIMNGLELTHWVMENIPTPILVISVSVQDHADDQLNIFNFLKAGALDIIAKPRDGVNKNNDSYAKTLKQKVRVLSGVHMIPRMKSNSTTPFKESAEAHTLKVQRNIDIIVIGSSTGGPKILQQIFSSLPANFPLPIICVQHVSDSFLPGLVNWLNVDSQLKIQIAQDGIVPESGNVYFAPEKSDLIIGRDHCLHLDFDNQHSIYLPSVDMTFSSMAKHFSNRVLAILLTGMGADGAKGLRELADAGNMTIAQDKESCVVFGMPKVAIELGAARYIMPPEGIIYKIKEAAGIKYKNILC